MAFNLHSVCQLAFFSLCCMFTTVSDTESTFVPGRCLCPRAQSGVRGQLKALTILPQTARCNNIEVIVTLKGNNSDVCLDPKKPMGKQLIRCWQRVQRLGRDVKVCLRRKRRRSNQPQGQRMRSKGQSKRMSSSNS